MDWTTKLPNKQGVYWWSIFGHTPTIVEIIEEEGRILFCDTDEAFPVEGLGGPTARFYGPIVPPPLPEKEST